MTKRTSQQQLEDALHEIVNSYAFRNESEKFLECAKNALDEFRVNHLNECSDRLAELTREAQQLTTFLEKQGMPTNV